MSRPTRRQHDYLMRMARIAIAEEARMLPKETSKITPSMMVALRQQAREYLASESISLSMAAGEMGRSESSLSQWLSASYKGNNANMTIAVDRWMTQRKRRDDARMQRRYVSTWVATEMQGAAMAAITLEKMAVIISPSGSGKDMVIQHLIESMDAIYIYADEDMTPSGLRDALLDRYNIPRRGSASAMKQALVAKAHERSCPIFINEAHQLRPKCASFIRMLHDQARIPILLFGADELVSWADDRSQGRGQFWSRCLKFNILNRMSRAEDPDDPTGERRRLFTYEEVKRVLEAEGLKLTRDVVTMLADIACLEMHGTLRLAVETVRLARQLVPVEEIDVDIIREALFHLADSEASSIEMDLSHFQQETRGRKKTA